MIKYVVGDATEPISKSPKELKLITHVCNDIGGWGRGFVLSLSKKWPHVEADYRAWHAGTNKIDPLFELGQVKFVKANAEGVFVANMIAQHDVITVNGVPPIRYEALDKCFRHITYHFQHAKTLGIADISVHMPRIGCGLAGGVWSEVSKIVEKRFDNTGVDVYVYDFDTKDVKTVPWNN